MKTGRMPLSTVVLFLTLMRVFECTKLAKNHDVITELTDAMQRIEAKFSEAEKRAATTEAEMKLMKRETSEAIQRLEAKFAETEAKKNEELQEMKRENSRMIAELADTVLTQDTDIYAKLSELTENQGKHYYSRIYFLNIS